MTRAPILRAKSAPLAAAIVLLLGGCRDAAPEPRLAPDLNAFKAMARAADCDDVRNRLFLIDGRSVFWDREGTCADQSYAYTLFGSEVTEVLCDRHDAIGGGNVTTCADDRYRDMFDAIVTNLDEPELGIGAAHTVQEIPF